MGLSSEDALATMPDVTPAAIAAGLDGLKAAYLESFRYVWVTAGVFSAAAATGKFQWTTDKCAFLMKYLAALFLINPTKDFNMHVDAPLEKDK